jgi:hypothetical protein
MLLAIWERLDEGIKEFWDSLGFYLATSAVRCSLIFYIINSCKPLSRQFWALALLTKISCPFYCSVMASYSSGSFTTRLLLVPGISRIFFLEAAVAASGFSFSCFCEEPPLVFYDPPKLSVMRLEECTTRMGDGTRYLGRSLLTSKKKLRTLTCSAEFARYL